MPKTVFISYRRDDSKYQARGIYDALKRLLPRDDVFMDIDSIPPGADFVETLEGWVDQCEILLALIGPGWSGAPDPKTGRRRLDNPNDFVRVEIRAALARDIAVVPILLDGAPMPHPDELPDDVKKLGRRQAEFVEYRTFDADVNRLIARLGLAPPEGGKGSAGMSDADHPPPHTGPEAKRERERESLKTSPPEKGAEHRNQQVTGNSNPLLLSTEILLFHTNESTSDARAAMTMLVSHGASVKLCNTKDGYGPLPGRMFYGPGLLKVAEKIKDIISSVDSKVTLREQSGNGINLYIC